MEVSSYQPNFNTLSSIFQQNCGLFWSLEISDSQYESDDERLKSQYYSYLSA